MTQVYWIYLVEHGFSEGYVGISENAQRRFQQHKKYIKRQTNPHLKNALEKYGDRIKFLILFEGKRSDCLKLERELRPEKKMGWNIEAGGGDPPKGNWKGRKHTEETKELLRQKALERYSDPEFKKKIEETQKRGEEHPFFGKPRSEETKKKISEGNKGNKNWVGKEHSGETKEKMKKSQQAKKYNRVGEKNGMFGKEHQEEAKLKMAQARANKKWITNGIDNKSIEKDLLLPEGWRLGRTLRKATS